jgi:hypothetical protein
MAISGFDPLLTAGPYILCTSDYLRPALYFKPKLLNIYLLADTRENMIEFSLTPPISLTSEKPQVLSLLLLNYVICNLTVEINQISLLEKSDQPESIREKDSRPSLFPGEPDNLE